MSSTAYTLENLHALEAAIVSGATRVKYSDKEIEYRSLREMKELRRDMRLSLGLVTTGGRAGLFGGRRIVARHSKGLDES